MAITTQIITDTRYRTNVKYLCDAAANANVELLDVSDLMGFATGGKVNLAKILLDIFCTIRRIKHTLGCRN